MSDGAPVVVPRWEWRSFGRSADAEARLAALRPDSVHESEEVYLLSRHVEHAVKVRDGLMDVKHLERVDDRGLERWRPTMKSGFPLPAADVRAVWAALGLEGPPPGGGERTLDRLLGELAETGADILVVEVRKRRQRYTLDGCGAERTAVRVGRCATWSLAVESEDPDRVARTVEALGLPLRPNISYPRALRGMAGAGGSRYAVIDVGSHSVKSHVAERGADGAWRTVADRAEVTRLGEGLAEAGALGPAPVRRTIQAICDMADEARGAGAFDIAAVGTAAMRAASNAADLIEAVWQRCGVRVEVVSGEEESRLSHLAVTAMLGGGGGSVVVFETGGGSSQFTFGHGERVDERFSVDVGTARYVERFGLDGVPAPGAIAAARAAIAADLERLDGRPRPDALVGIGGTFTNLAAVKHGLAVYAPDVVHGTVLDRAEIDRQIELYADLAAEGRRRIVGLQPARAEAILAGACIVREGLDTLGAPAITVSDRGLRHGLLIERFGAGPDPDAEAPIATGSPRD